MRVWATAFSLFVLVIAPFGICVLGCRGQTDLPCRGGGISPDAPVHGAAEDRFVSKLTLPTGATVVVAEGDFEARSIGSFSVRLYEAASAEDETTFFVSGLIHSRDGVVEDLTLADVDGDLHQEIVVIARSVGTGSYLSAYAFSAAGDKLIFRAEVEGLAPDADPVEALRARTKEQQ
jgi:hypothetical protein